jgi:Abortive infection alpha
MDDPIGLGPIAESVAKIGDSQLANKAYDDLAAGAMREGGKALTELVKAFRLFLAPIQFAAAWQDRLAAYCDRVRAKVPEDRQQEAASSIALPILMDLRFMEDDNPLTKLYLNLLARVIDKERCNEAHPAFVKIIEQMSPDEAMVVWQFSERDSWVRPPPGEQCVEPTFPRESLIYPENFSIYAEHLAALNLLRLPIILPLAGEAPLPLEYGGHSIYITRFGQQFVKACIPEDFDLAEWQRAY